MNALFAALFALAVLSYFVQPLSIPATFLFAFAVPGFLLVEFFAARMNALEKCVVSLAASVLLSTLAVYLTSLMLGYSRESILAAFVLLSLLALLPKRIALDVRGIAGHRNAIIAALLLFAFLLYFFSATLWVRNAHGIVVGGWNYGDFFVHMPIIKTLNAGNFPPQVPFFAGMPLQYHWFADFHTAFVSLYGAAAPEHVVWFENSLYVAAFLLSVYALALLVLRNKKVALLAALIAIFGGGFGYARLFGDAQSADALVLASSKAYDNDWGFFLAPSMLPGYLLPQRAQMIALPALVSIVILLLRGGAKQALFAGILAGMLLPFHYHAYLAVLVIAGIFFLPMLFGKRRHEAFRHAAAFFTPALLIALPFLLPALSSGAAGSFKFSLGWGFTRYAANLPAILMPLLFLFYYVANLGIPFALALLAIASKAAKRKWLAHEPFLALWLVAMLAIPNMLTFKNLEWDMAKLFTYLWIPASIFSAALLARLARPLAALLVIASIASPLLTVYWWLGTAVNPAYTTLSNGDIAAAEWIATATPEMSVFVTQWGHVSPVDSLAGRLRADGYYNWLYAFGGEKDRRDALIRDVYCGSAAQAATAMRLLNASYAYLGSSEHSFFSGCATRFEKSDAFTLRYDRNGIKIYAFNG